MWSGGPVPKGGTLHCAPPYFDMESLTSDGNQTVTGGGIKLRKSYRIEKLR